MKYSVITICYNASDCVADTIRSIVGQTSPDFEFILVDGASKDDTVKIVRSILKESEFPEERTLIISEPDKGIYDAMNKGVLHAHGDFINFMNAGDRFHDDRVLEIASKYIDNSAEVYYGSTVSFTDTKCRNEAPRELDCIVKQMPFVHQASFTSRKLLVEHPFQLEYKIAADYEFFLWAYQNGQRFRRLDMTVADFAIGGICTSNVCESAIDQYRAARSLGVLPDWQFYTKCANRRVRKFVKSLLPKSILDKREAKAFSEQKGWRLL